MTTTLRKISPKQHRFLQWVMEYKSRDLSKLDYVRLKAGARCEKYEVNGIRQRCYNNWRHLWWDEFKQRIK